MRSVRSHVVIVGSVGLVHEAGVGSVGDDGSADVEVVEVLVDRRGQPTNELLALESRVLVLSEVLEDLVVDDEVEAAGAVGSELAHDDVLSDAGEVVGLCVEGGLVEDLDGLLEGALPEGPRVDPVDAVPRDGGEDASLRHDVAERAEVAVVHVDAVAAEDEPDLVDQRETHRLDAQHLQDLLDVVRVRSLEVDLLEAQDLGERHSVRLDQPVQRRVLRVVLHLLARLWVVVILIVLGECDLADLRDTTDGDFIEKLIHELLEVHSSGLFLIILISIDVLSSESHHELICIVIRVHLVDLVLESLLDFAGYLLHREVTSSDLLRVELKTHHPRREVLVPEVLNAYIIVGHDHLLILLNKSSHRVGIVVDLTGSDQVSEGGVLDLCKQ